MFFFSSRRRHTRYWRDWSSDVCSSDLDLRGAFVDLEDLRVAHQLLDGVLARVAVAAEDLHRVERHLHRRIGRERSEERRVGKECRSRWSPDHYKKKQNKQKQESRRHTR